MSFMAIPLAECLIPPGLLFLISVKPSRILLLFQLALMRMLGSVSAGSSP